MPRADLPDDDPDAIGGAPRCWSAGAGARRRVPGTSRSAARSSRRLFGKSSRWPPRIRFLVGIRPCSPRPATSGSHAARRQRRERGLDRARGCLVASAITAFIAVNGCCATPDQPLHDFGVPNRAGIALLAWLNLGVTGCRTAADGTVPWRECTASRLASKAGTNSAERSSRPARVAPRAGSSNAETCGAFAKPSYVRRRVDMANWETATSIPSLVWVRHRRCRGAGEGTGGSRVYGPARSGGRSVSLPADELADGRTTSWRCERRMRARRPAASC